METDDDLEAITAIYDALDEGRAADALVACRTALAPGENDDPVLRFLAGRALLELERPAEAERELRRAVELDPEDAEFRTDHAEALFFSLNFEGALEQARRASELDPAYADAQYLLGLALEHTGDLDGADRQFKTAVKLDPEQFPSPCRVDRDTFDQLVKEARAALPSDFSEHLGSIGLLVEDLPSMELLTEEEPPLPPELLGLFSGVPHGEPVASGTLPPRIYLFRRNLERQCTSREQLAEQIRVTLFHELGHYLGMDEDELERAGYA
jgi:predicted Zn-dependent protease with MMP-like domain